MSSDDLFCVSSCSPPSTANANSGNSNLARFRKFDAEHGLPPLPDPSPECIAATIEALRLTDELYDRLAARGVDLNDERQVSDKKFDRLIAAIDRQVGLDRFDGREQTAALLWLLDHGASA